MITQYLLTMITLAIGIWIGYMLGKQQTLDKTIQTLAQHISKPFHKGITPGGIKRPNVIQYNKLNEPAKMRESKEAIKQALDQIPEIQEHKRILEEHEQIRRRN